MHSFERQDCRTTLADGIREYHQGHPDMVGSRGTSPEAREFFRCHDAAHVVFGCGNALDDEAVVKIASLFGTTAGFSVLRGYRLHESTEIYRTLPPREVIATIFKSVAIVPMAIARCRSQRRKWEWSDFDRYLTVPLDELRAEFGIRVRKRR